MDGPYARRKFWQNFTVAGGKRDEKGESIGWNITKSSFRAMIDSRWARSEGREPGGARQAQARGARAARRHRLRGAHHDGAQERRQRRRNNRIANVVLPGEPEYAKVMAGQPVPPDPVNAAPRKPARWRQAAVAPAWSQQGSSAAAHRSRAPAGAPAAAPATSSPQWLNS